MWKLGREAAQFPEKEYINGTFAAVYRLLKTIKGLKNREAVKTSTNQLAGQRIIKVCTLSTNFG